MTNGSHLSHPFICLLPDLPFLVPCPHDDDEAFTFEFVAVSKDDSLLIYLADRNAILAFPQFPAFHLAFPPCCLAICFGISTLVRS